MASGKRITTNDWASVLTDVAAGLSQAESADRAEISSAALRRWKHTRHAWWDLAVEELRKHLAEGQPRGVVVQRARELVLGREPEVARVHEEPPLTWAVAEEALRVAASDKPESYWIDARERAARIAGVEDVDNIPAELVLATAWKTFRDPRLAEPQGEAA